MHLLVNELYEILLFVGNREVPGYDGYPVQHMRDDSWLGGAVAVQDNGERVLVR